MQDQFINLHCQTYYSIGESLLSPKELLIKAKELNQCAVACTDRSLFAAWDLYKAAKELGNIKPIIGMEFNFAEDLSIVDKSQRLRHLILIAKNANGYRNLLNISRISYDHSFINFKKLYSRINWEILNKYSEDLICLTSGATGILGQPLNTRNKEKAFQDATKLKEIFGPNLGLEIQSHAMVRQANNYADYIDQTFTNKSIIDIAEKLNIRVVPTCNVMYSSPDDANTHDVMLSISSGQPIKSNARLRYTNKEGNPLPEFYLKTREQVESFFKRIYKEKSKEWCDNTLYFADQCEYPDWIDPAFSNPSKKELPEFPVQDQVDYSAFLEWRKEHLEFDSLPEDGAYIRYKCLTRLENLELNNDEKSIYLNRLNLELEVFDLKGLNSYLAIVQDYLLYCDKNGIPRGPGRGCLKGDTLVLSLDGWKKLHSINIGDKVYTHLGEVKSVVNKFEFAIKDEECLEIKTTFGDKAISMTSDHKIYGAKNVKFSYKKKYKNKHNDRFHTSTQKSSRPGTLDWYPASALKPGDWIFTPYVKRIKNTYNNAIIDLSLFCEDKSIIKNDLISCFKRNRNLLPPELELRNLAKTIKIGINHLSRAKTGTDTLTANEIFVLKKELSKYSLSYETWKKSYGTYYDIKRFIELDEDFYYLIGRWVGDGSYTKDGINIAFNIKDESGICRIENILSKLGFYHFRSVREKLNCTVVICNNKILKKYFQSIIPDYLGSETKHLPSNFRDLSSSNLKYLLQGVIDSDGHIVKNKQKITISSISYRLILELRELLSFLHIPAHIAYLAAGKSKKIYNRKCSYHLDFSFVKSSQSNFVKYVENGYLTKILEITSINLDKVYDIMVEDHHSYLTINGSVHNSVGGSLAAYLLNIHKADPIKYDLIFERFYNKQKSAMADIDCDFSKAGKKEVENYITTKYGSDKVAGISNILTLTPKPYVKAISRVFQYGGDFKTAVKVGIEIGDSISDEYHKIEDVISHCPLFGEYCVKYPELLKFKKLCGLPISHSVHAAGKIIGRRKLADIVPVRKDKEGNVVIEYEKERAEENGLVKMDILGLETLDIIKETNDLITKNGKELGIFDYHTVDEKAYDLISKGDTFTVFQLGTSGGTIDLCRKIKPKSIEDISIINALARPSAAEFRAPFIDAKEGKKIVKLLHPKLDRAFKSTYGFGLFEESLLFVAQDVAGWTLNEADNLRKLTKDKGKHPEKVAKWKEDFINGSIKNGVDDKIAKRIWEETIEGFGGYGFPKIHSTLYSLISYHTAYLKAHFPLEFLTANLIAEANSNTKDAPKNVLKIKSELKKLNIKIIPPDINKSNTSFTIVDSNTIMTGLDALKFIGKDAIPEIIAKRPFASFQDFLTRVDGRKVRSPAVQALAASGALDTFNLTRQQMFLYGADYKKKLKLWLTRRPGEEFIYPFPEEKNDWSIPEKYAMEVKYLGEGLTGTFREIYPNFFNHHAINFLQLKTDFPTNTKHEVPGKYGVLQGVIEDYFEFRVKREDSPIVGQTMGRMLVRDPFGNSVNCVMFPDTLTEYKKRIQTLKKNVKLEPGIAIHFGGNINWYESELTIVCQTLKKVSGIPTFPKDIKARSISMKILSVKKNKDNKLLSLFDDMEEELIEQGLTEEESAEEADYFDIIDEIEHSELNKV